MSGLLSDFIYHKNTFPIKLCDQIIEAYRDELFNRYTNQNDDRHLGEIQISDHNIIDKKNSYVRKTIEQDIYKFIGALIQDYKKTTNAIHLKVDQDIGYSLRQMNIGDFYAEHDDDGYGEETGSRTLTVSICLNEEYEGGEFTFFNESKIISFQKGDVLVFPSSFMFPHGVKKITNGTRYQLLTWLR
tara:strand:- start:10473 stop:11033 length:561 start_codon:yes stop_codon:yes gene_type:complete